MVGGKEEHFVVLEALNVFFCTFCSIKNAAFSLLKNVFTKFTQKIIEKVALHSNLKQEGTASSTLYNISSSWKDKWCCNTRISSSALFLFANILPQMTHHVLICRYSLKFSYFMN